MLLEDLLVTSVGLVKEVVLVEVAKLCKTEWCQRRGISEVVQKIDSVHDFLYSC